MHKRVSFTLPGAFNDAELVQAITTMLETDGSARISRDEGGRFLPAWNEAPYVPIREWRRLYQSMHTCAQAKMKFSPIFGTPSPQLLVVATYSMEKSTFLGYEFRLMWSSWQEVQCQISLIAGL